MFDLIVLGVVLAGLYAISRAPLPKQRPAPPVCEPRAHRTDWSELHRPTYLRRGLVPGERTAQSAPTGHRVMADADRCDADDGES